MPGPARAAGRLRLEFKSVAEFGFRIGRGAHCEDTWPEVDPLCPTSLGVEVRSASKDAGGTRSISGTFQAPKAQQEADVSAKAEVPSPYGGSERGGGGLFEEENAQVQLRFGHFRIEFGGF